jgi:hypothetical protein
MEPFSGWLIVREFSLIFTNWLVIFARIRAD